MAKTKTSKEKAREYAQELREVLGSRLRTYRKAKGLTQKQASELSGVHAVDISRIESGITENPTIDSLLRLAWVYEIDPGVLLEDVKLETITIKK